MLIALLITFLFVGGSGSAPFLGLVTHFQSATKGVVVEPARHDAAHAVLKEMAATISSHEKGRDHTMKAFVKLGGEYDATSAQYREILEAEERKNTAFQEAMIVQLRELKGHITAAEWAAIVAKMKPKPAGS